MSNPSIPDSLEFKPDFAEARRYWAAFWAGEIIDRPGIMIRAPKEGVEYRPRPPYPTHPNANFDTVIDQVLENAACTYYAGEAIPCYTPSFGPDMFAGFLGVNLEYSPDSSGTSWSMPTVENWEDVLPIRLDVHNPLWQRMLEFVRHIVERCEGKLLCSHIDLHSNLDALAAMRLPQRLCLDMYDCPELIDRAMEDVRRIYFEVYSGLYYAGKMDKWGSLGWGPFYGEGRTNYTQCDFILLLSPEMSRRWVIPALAEECAFLDHSVYHYDGPQALVHLEDICSIPDLDVISWVPGARNPGHAHYIELFQKIQSLGKGLDINCTIEQLPYFVSQLRPEKVMYSCWAKSEKEADDTIRWLKNHT
ncbi:MAG: hypothetical protein ACUVX8_10820 [Candidatus Zipacnadales bacterium]